MTFFLNKQILFSIPIFLLRSIDLGATMLIDINIENERDAASSDAAIYCIQGLCRNNDISPKVKDSAVNSYRKKLDAVNKSTESEFQSELAKKYNDISSRNQVFIIFWGGRFFA